MLLTNKHIFVVEDNAQNRVVFHMALLRQGATIDFERWGSAAVERLRGLGYVDAIILDLMLANNVSGFDLFNAIRAVPSFASIPIVAVSAMDAAVAIPEARKRGFSGFIAKPIDTLLFPQQIAKLIEGEEIWYSGERKIT